MFSGGMPFILARARLPSTEGKPRKSTLTIATRISLFASTSARTVRSPSFFLTGLDGPTPPETGRSGSGVTTRTAMPARNSACATAAVKAMLKTAKNVLSFILPGECPTTFSHRFARRTIEIHYQVPEQTGITLVKVRCFSALVFNRDVEETHPGSDVASSCAQAHFGAGGPCDVTIFKEKIAPGWRVARDAMHRSGYLFEVVVRGPCQSRVVNVRGLRADSLEPVDEDRGLGIPATHFVSVKPVFSTLRHGFHARVLIFSAR